MLNTIARTVCTSLVGAGLLLSTPPATAQSAEPISFQARIDGVGDGLVQLSFDVFDTIVGGVPINEEPIVVADAAVADGVVSVSLPVSPLWFTGQARYLAITVDGKTLADRLPIVAAPRALSARTLLDPNGNSWLHWSGNQLQWIYEPGFANFDKWSLGQANITPGDLGFALRNLTEDSHPSGSESWVFVDQATGFVGIGIDEPIAPLQVWGDIVAGDDVVAPDAMVASRAIIEDEAESLAALLATNSAGGGDLSLVSSSGNEAVAVGENVAGGGVMKVISSAGVDAILASENAAGGGAVAVKTPSDQLGLLLSGTGGDGHDGLLGIYGGPFEHSRIEASSDGPGSYLWLNWTQNLAIRPQHTLSLTPTGGAGYLATHGAFGNPMVELSTRQDEFADSAGAVYVNEYTLSGGIEPRAGIVVDGGGKGIVFGDLKNFRVENPMDPQTEIWYASLEGPEAAAYCRGRAMLRDGACVVPLPEHFRSVANLNDLTVQLTPSSPSSLGLACVERGPDGFVVRELNNGRGTYTFDWHVVATRAGYEDYQVVRKRMQERPDPRESANRATASDTPREARR